MFTLEIKQFIQAAHRLPKSNDLVTKECSNLHGHSYLVKTEIKTRSNNRSGMVVDFKGVKNIVNILDHQFVNDIFRKYKFNQPSTAENIAKFLHQQILGTYDFYGLKVSVCEGYKGEESSNWVHYEG